MKDVLATRAVVHDMTLLCFCSVSFIFGFEFDDDSEKSWIHCGPERDGNRGEMTMQERGRSLNA